MGAVAQNMLPHGVFLVDLIGNASEGVYEIKMMVDPAQITKIFMLLDTGLIRSDQPINRLSRLFVFYNNPVGIQLEKLVD